MFKSAAQRMEKKQMRGTLFFALTLFAASVAYPVQTHPDGRTHRHSDSEKSRAFLEAKDVDVFVEPHHTVIQVNGVVCSFCVYGAEKSLSKLDGLDRSEFGKGVLVDIHTQRITLAMTPGTEIPIEDIHRRIRKAGYDPVAVYLRIAGTLESVGGNLLIKDAQSGQLFSLVGADRSRAVGASVDVQARVVDDAFASVSDGAPIPVVVDKWISDSVDNDE